MIVEFLTVCGWIDFFIWSWDTILEEQIKSVYIAWVLQE